jgi:DNA-binding response OmpR family regulator
MGDNYSMPDEERVYDLTEASLSEQGQRVLLLEDDATLSKVLEEYLSAHSFQVTCVPSGVEGLRQIMARDFNVILCDMVMPHVPGDMFYLAVERTKPALCKRFIFMTGYKADPKIDYFLRKMGGCVLWKPFETAQLSDAINVILRRDRAGSG